MLTDANNADWSTFSFQIVGIVVICTRNSKIINQRIKIKKKQSIMEKEENTEISLIDENGINYTLKVSAEDATRAQKDLMFATSLLEMAKMQSNTESTVSSISDEGDSNESLFKWSHAATLFLVEEYRRQEKNLTSGKISQKKGWNNIALALSTKGYNVTGSQCISKFHGMKRTYKSIKDHNSKSGNNPRSWPYMEVMESLLGERPFMSPPAIASSSNTCHLKNVLTPSSANTLSDVDLTKPNPRKRKAQEETLTIAKAITQSRQLAENNKEQRHKERMDFRKEMLGFMQKMLEKL